MVEVNKYNVRAYDYKLDLLRFYFFFLVFFCHFVSNGGVGNTEQLKVWWQAEIIERMSNFGREGVTMFFVLSGFLLCKLLNNELLTFGKVSISNFIMRRVYRIWPLYFLFLIILFFINLFTNNTGFKSFELPFLLTFSYNWAIVFNNVGGSISSITWSLSIEEQIYLLLSLIAIVKLRNRFLLGSISLFSFGTISIIYCRVYFIDSLYLTTSYFIPFSIGMYIAINENLFRVVAIKKRSMTIGSVLFIFLYHIFYEFMQNSNYKFSLFYLSSIYFICLLHVCDKYLSQNWLINHLAKVGKITYGCYLYHFVILFVFIRFNIFLDQEGFRFVGVVTALVLTIFVSYISYYFFELYFLRKREKFLYLD